MLRFDHLAVSGTVLADATHHLETCLGLDTVAGGQHPHFATHNTLMGCGDAFYLEAISPDPTVPAPSRARWFGLDQFKGPARLTNWILACDDLDAALDKLGPGFGAPVALTRGDFRWRMAVPDSGVLPFDGLAPAVIQWDGDAHPAPRLPDSGARFLGLQVRHPDAAAMAALLTPVLDDDRVTYVEGEAGMMAAFDTADGVRKLT